MKDCKDTIRSHFTTDGVLTVPPVVPSGRGPRCKQYSFDFAQQVHCPSKPLQPGPMYFKTARKCTIFGVCCEGVPRQENYLIDEASDTGKGANTVISHHLLKHHGLVEVEVGMHADNSVQDRRTTLSCK